MRIAAVLCWYDEPVELLDRCVRSLAGVVDWLVAVDGRWEPFPAVRDLSPLEQTVTIERAARDVGLQLVCFGAGAPFAWDSQIEKRDFAMDLAHRRQGVDWVLVIDADEYVFPESPVVRAPRISALRQSLELTEHHVATVTLRNVTVGDFYMVEKPRRRLFRAGTTVSQSHQGYTYDGVPLDGDTRFGLKRAEALDVRPLLLIEHTPASRGPERNAAAREYRHARARIGER